MILMGKDVKMLWLKPVSWLTLSSLTLYGETFFLVLAHVWWRSRELTSEAHTEENL